MAKSPARRVIEYATPGAGREAPPRVPVGGPWWRSRGAFLLVFAAVVMSVVVAYAQERWLAVVTLALSDGLVVALWVASAWLLGRRVLALADDIPLPLRFTTWVGVGLGVLSLAALVLGLAGMLNFFTAVLLVLAGPLLHVREVLAWFRGKPEVHVERWFAKPLGHEWLLLAAAPLVGTMLTGASIVPGLLWKPEDPHPYDALEYHLQIPREWYEMGRIAPLRHNVFCFFPNGVEMQYLLAMHVRGGPWAAMYQCQFFSLAWSVLTAVAVYGAIRQLAPGCKLGAPAGAVLALSTPWLVMLGSVPYTESALAMYTALAAAWAMRAMRAESPLRPMIVGGVMAGLACGVKYTAVPMVLLAIPAALLIVAAANREARRWWRPVAAFGVVGGVVVSPWLIRNVAWTRNPVFPLAMSTLGRAHFDTVQVERFRLAHSPSEQERPLVRRVARAGRVIFADWQYGYVVWPVAAGAAVIAWRRREARFIMGYLLIVLVVWVGFTHLLGRFYVLTIPVAAMTVGLVPRRAWNVAAAGAAVLAVGLSMPMVHGPLAHFAGVAQNGLFGLDDLSYFVPPELAEMDRPDARVSLVGDAEGFLYRIPSSRLRYRTVFDLPGDAADMYEAWMGAKKADAKGLIVLNPAEVERLSRTYYKVPGLPADYSGPTDRPVILKR